MADEKIYIGSGKEHKFENNGGSSIKILMCVDNFKELYEQYGFTSKEGKHYFPMLLNSKKTVDQYGKTHSLQVDTYKPEKRQDSF